MSKDPYELMSEEFDKRMREQGQNGMSQWEFELRMQQLSWELDELERKTQELRNGQKKGTATEDAGTPDGDRPKA